MDGKSSGITKDKLEQLKAILPEAFTEGKVDWEKLRRAAAVIVRAMKDVQGMRG